MSRIDTLDLRDAVTVRRHVREELVKERGWWTDWDAFEWFPPRRRIRVDFKVDARAFHKAIRRAALSMSTMTPIFKNTAAAAADVHMEMLKLRAITGAKFRPWWWRWLSR